jgi:hypothetical protein
MSETSQVARFPVTIPTRTLGQGLEVSAIGLGCMRMTSPTGPSTDRGAMIALIRDAVDRGHAAPSRSTARIALDSRADYDMRLTSAGMCA